VRQNPEFRSGRLALDYDHVETRGVLAGAYRGKDFSVRPTYTHLVFVGPRGEERGTGCRVDNLVDTYGHDEAFLRSRPTCPTCAKKWDKIPEELRGRRDERGEQQPVLEVGRLLLRLVDTPRISYAGFQGGKILRVGPKNVRVRIVFRTRPDGPWFEQEHLVPKDDILETAPDDGTVFAERTPNGGHYVWIIDSSGDPVQGEGPYGPFERMDAESFARIGATKGRHSRVVTRGLRPEHAGFKLVAEYNAGTGEKRALS